MFRFIRFRFEYVDPVGDMPGLSDVEVGLGEVLEVNGAPLQEHQLWAVLAHTAQTIQDLYLTGDHSGFLLLFMCVSWLFKGKKWWF